MKPYRSPDTPTVADLNAPGGYFNPAYNAKLALARRDRARARKYEARRLRGQPHPVPLGGSNANGSD